MSEYIDKLAFLYLHQGRLLVTLSRGKDVWYIPGGKREPGESDEQALKREVKEELNVDIKPESIAEYGVFEAQAHGKPAGTIVRMTCYTADFAGELQASSEVEKLDFFEYARMQETSEVDHLIFEDLRAKGLL